MGLNQFTSAVRQNDNDETASAVEMHNLRDTPLEVRTRPPMTTAQKAWQFIHPVAWIFLLCIGGPILVKELANHYLSGSVSQYGIIQLSRLPCDAQAPWTSWSTLFEVNIRTGHLSFSNAKIIDVAFDIVVGRGGQACLVWIAYRVYTDVLIHITESQNIRYELFAAIALRPNDIRTLGIAVTSVSSTMNLRTKFMLVWTTLAMLYVLAYPTLISAATSLVGATTTSIRLANNGTVPINAYIITASYSFADTGLDNKPNPWIVPVADITRMGTPSNVCNIMDMGNHPYSGLDGNALTVNQTTYTLGNTTQTSCGFYYGDNFYQIDDSVIKGSLSVNRLFGNQIICQPDGHNYQWGASWELLVVILILQIIWSLSLLFMWIEVTKKSQLVRRGRKMGLWRAIVDLAEPLLMRLGPGNGMCSQEELSDSVRQIPYVHYEAKVEEVQDGGYSQDVHLVSSIGVAETPPPIIARQRRTVSGS